MSDQKKKPDEKEKPGADEVTRAINPATDTLKIDLELAKATDPVLIVIRGSLQGKKYSLKGQNFIIGRDRAVDIQIEDGNVSRQHAKIFQQNEKFYIEDLGSRNGTYLNDEKISEGKIALEKEDMIKVGSTVLKFLPAGQLETLYHINLANAASIDKLTGLYNRKYITEVLEVEFKRSRALHTPMSIVIFDIDNFKNINTTNGHAGGDYVLTKLGAQIKACGLRERDLAGRFGGEEFLIVLSNSDTDQAFEMAERIRKHIEQFQFSFDEKQIPVTISLGVATTSKAFSTYNELYKAADKALYESKHSGKNKTTIFKP